MAVPSAINTASDLVLNRRGDRRRALLFEGSEWSWHQVVEEGNARATLLESLSAGSPHVGVLLENTPEYLFLLAGAALRGSVIVGLNPTRRGEELARDIRKTDCHLVVTDSSQRSKLDGLELGLGPDAILVADSDDYRTRVAALEGSPMPTTVPDAEDLYLLIFTSGSTGHPKAVRMTQGRAARGAARIRFTPDDILYCAMPLFHGNALSSSVFPALASGATIALRRRFSASGFLPDIRATRATFFSAVGRAVAHIVATPPTDHDRDHHLRYALGPETSAPDKAEFTRRFGVPLFEGYGSSENAIVLLPVPDARPGALGRAKGQEDIAVINAETNVECPRAIFDDSGQLANPSEAIGELVGRSSSSNFEGYYKDPEAEAERIRHGWYWSGDLSYRDAEGVFYFAGRAGDWMRVDSENFTAAPIERILERFDGLSGVAVYAVPDSRTGDQVMAALEFESGSLFDPVEFEKFLGDQPDLGTKWAPRYLRITSRLPVTGTDKIDKAPLRSQQWNTTDPLWHRAHRSPAYVPMSAADVAALRSEFVANGRTTLLQDRSRPDG